MSCAETFFKCCFCEKKAGRREERQEAIQLRGLARSALNSIHPRRVCKDLTYFRITVHATIEISEHRIFELIRSLVKRMIITIIKAA